VSPTLQLLDSLRVRVGLRGYQQLRRFARRWPGASWTIDGAGGPALFLARRAAEGPDAVDVPAKLGTWFAFHRHGRKNDAADAVAVAATSLTRYRLQSLRSSAGHVNLGDGECQSGRFCHVT
jgi:transposase